MSDSADVPVVAGPPADRLTKHTAVISSLNLLSRLTGFGRILVVAAVLGTTFLGNTYQSANSVPNLVFELFAAGALQAVLVPTLVAALARGGREEAVRVANIVLGSLLAAMTAVLAIGLVLAPLIARALFAGSPAGADQVRLGTVFLWLFLPQILFYVGGLVATAILNADDHFGVPAFAPIVNNVVVTVAYVAFWALRRGDVPSLHLSPVEVAVLAGGTTLGVVSFTSVPLIWARRHGFALMPRLHRGGHELRDFWRQGAWAAGFLGLTQLLLMTVLVLANRVEGGVVAYQLGFTYFLLPHALVAIPVFTALFPGMARAALGNDAARFTALVRRGTHAIAVLVLPAAAGMVALAEPIARLTLFGNGEDGLHQVALATRWLAPGLAPYGLFLLLTRAAYARGEARLPTEVNLVATALGVGAMVASAIFLAGDARVAGLAAAHSLTYVVAVIVLGVRMSRRIGGGGPLVRGGALVAGLVATGAAAGVMAWVASLVRMDGRLGAAVELAVAGGAGVLTYGTLVLLARVGSPFSELRDEGADDA